MCPDEEKFDDENIDSKKSHEIRKIYVTNPMHRVLLLSILCKILLWYMYVMLNHNVTMKKVIVTMFTFFKIPLYIFTLAFYYIFHLTLHIGFI